MRDNITPLIITYNEAANIRRTLERLAWAKQIVVVDSFSDDQTLDIISKFPQVQVFQRAFDSFAAQCNFGLEKISTEWVLSIDADYLLTDELIEELSTLEETRDINSYSARFKYCVWGKQLKGTLYPPRKVLYRIRKAIYHEDGHAHRVRVEGECRLLSSYILHDDRKSLSRWAHSQSKYVERESEKLQGIEAQKLGFNDRLRRRKVLAPFLVLIYCLIIHRGILDGWAGWYYAFQRILAELLLSVKLINSEKLGEKDDLITWLRIQDDDATTKSKKLLGGQQSEVTPIERIRATMILAPFLVLITCLTLRGGLLDGWAGVCSSFQNTIGELLLSLRLIEGGKLLPSINPAIGMPNSQPRSVINS